LISAPPPAPVQRIEVTGEGITVTSVRAPTGTVRS
jgi:hypothetical protein